MKWNNFKYRTIAELISETDIDNMIDAMIDYHDNKGRFYEQYEAERFLKKYVNNHDVFSMIDDIVKREISENYSDQNNFILDELHELNVGLLRNSICSDIIYQISIEARKKSDGRIRFRHNKGEKIDLNLCPSQKQIQNKVEFYKDGGWGIAEIDGTVIVRNHLIDPPSKLHSLKGKTNRYFRVIQDRDTRLYGVLSVESFKEVIHCLYDKIEVSEYWFKNTNRRIIKVKKGEKWGCYDEDGAFVVDCIYDDISIKGNWIECCRDGEFLYPEYLDCFQVNPYNGVRDLYDMEGNLLIGGYNHLDIDEDYYKFYFGTTYKEFYTKERDYYDNEISRLGYELDFNSALCLVLDNHFNTMLQVDGERFQITRGRIYQNIQELRNDIPCGFLLSGKITIDQIIVDTSILSSFIYVTKRNHDSFIVSNYVPATPTNIIIDIEPIPEHWDDFLIEDDEVYIMKLEKDGTPGWWCRVNEVSFSFRKLHLYRIGERVGFFSLNGIESPLYSAISTDYEDEKIYVAQISYDKTETNGNQLNPNYIQHKEYCIRFFELKENGELIRLEDDWHVFNPTKHKWFPEKFLEANNIKEIEEYVSGYDDSEVTSRSYEKYGGYNGYDDDTIDDAFDGYPEATWNVD